jgi:DNA-directed RNA polymerase subunit RPC12/RpoP
MIICTDCGSPQFLQIINAVHEYSEEHGHAFAEEYECTLCGSRGAYKYRDDEDSRLYGDVTELAVRPKPS